jgi:Mrp family chromosome partitioning ATPase
MAAPPRIDPQRVEPEPPSEPESWAGKTLLPIDDLHAGPTGGGVVAPRRIISVGPAAMPAHPPAFDLHHDIDRESKSDIGDIESSQMVALRPPIHVAVAVAVAVAEAVAADESEPPVAPSRPLATRPTKQRWAKELFDPRLVLLLEPYSQRAASFRVLRDNLIAKNAPRIIAVSSGAAHEGKTTCAINLALAFSERPSTRVLLLEGNFYDPSLAKVFHIDATTPLAPDMSFPWLMPYRVAEVAHGFHVAAVMQSDGEPPPVFNSRWFDMVMGHLADADYDHVIIDGAALDGSAAVLQVVGLAEGTLLTVRSGNTTARTLRKAAEQIPRGRALGVTLMDGE